MPKKKINVLFYCQPGYYSNFACIGGKCPMTCCKIWNIDWTKYEVEKLKNADCSESLRALIDASFMENGEKYIIDLDEKRKCPFLTEDNFCAIQRELGEEYLSMVCKTYPRSSQLIGNTIVKYCYMSCYRIMDMLCDSKDCMILEKHLINKDNKEITTKFFMDTDIDYIQHPVLKYRKEIFELLYEIISDGSHSVETSITLGAVAAQSLDKNMHSAGVEHIPEFISSLKNQLKNPGQIKKLEELKPNYAIKLGFANELCKFVVQSSLIDMISENGVISVDKYNIAMGKFRSAFAERPFALRNIALNLLLECKMPFRDKNYSLFENYCYYVAAFAAIKLVAASFYTLGDNAEYGFKAASARISRNFAHNVEKVKPVLDVYRKLNFMSPAYIALIIK